MAPDIDPKLLRFITPPRRESEQGYDVIDGAIRHIHVTFKDFLENSEELFSLTPLQHVTLLEGGPGDVGKLFGSAAISRLRSISTFDAPASDVDLEILGASPHPTELRWLSIDRGRFTFAGFHAVVQSLYLERLRYFEPGSQSDDPRQRISKGYDGEYVHSPANGELLYRWYGAIRWLTPADEDYSERFKP